MASLLGAVFPTIVRYESAPASGSTTAFPPSCDMLVFTNGTTTAAQTVTLPANPVDGQIAMISNVSAITALTLSPTASGAPSGLTAGQCLWLMYSSTLPGWFVII